MGKCAGGGGCWCGMDRKRRRRTVDRLPPTSLCVPSLYHIISIPILVWTVEWLQRGRSFNSMRGGLGVGWLTQMSSPVNSN